MDSVVEFFPAAMVGHFNKITSNKDKEEYTFWLDGSPFKYDKLLYSFYYLKDRYKKIEKGKSYFDSIKYNGKRMIDSGGFQVRTQGADIKPEDVIDVYKRERADIGFILDIPMVGAWESENVKKSYENTEYMIKHKAEIPNTELLNVSHGYSLENRKKYYNIVKDFNNDLDGWAVGLIKKLPPIFNVWSFLYLYENDKTLKDKRFHFLGLTGNKNLPVVYYLGKLNLVKSISFDSTKYGREGIMYDIRNPSYKMERLSISKNAFGELKTNDFCPCPVCRITNIEKMKNDCDFSILHNLFWEIHKFKFFDAFKSAKDLKQHILESKDYYPETKLAINFIDYALENGLEKAEMKYKTELNAKNVPVKSKKMSEWC